MPLCRSSLLTPAPSTAERFTVKVTRACTGRAGAWSCLGLIRQTRLGSHDKTLLTRDREGRCRIETVRISDESGIRSKLEATVNPIVCLERHSALSDDAIGMASVCHARETSNISAVLIIRRDIPTVGAGMSFKLNRLTGKPSGLGARPCQPGGSRHRWRQSTWKELSVFEQNLGCGLRLAPDE